MIVLYSLCDRIMEFGAGRIKDHVGEHIRTIMTESNLSINEDDRSVVGLYQRYIFAYVLASKANDVSLLMELLFEDSLDPTGGWETQILDDGIDISTYQIKNGLPVSSLQTDAFAKTFSAAQVLPFCYGDDEQHQKAMEVIANLFTTEQETLTGLYGVMLDLMPGEYSTYYGDDYHNLVVSCHATLPQFG